MMSIIFGQAFAVNVHASQPYIKFDLQLTANADSSFVVAKRWYPLLPR